MYVQLHLEESPAFKQLEKLSSDRAAGAQTPGSTKTSGKPGASDSVSAAQARSPILEVIRLYPGRIALAAGAFLSIQVSFYILIAFVIAYGSNEAGLALSRTTMLTAVLIGAVLQLAVQFWAAAYSDRKGRRGIYMAGAVLTALWSFALFPLIDTGNFWLILLGVAGGLAFVGLQYGPQAALFTEMFSTRVRYSGASLGYQIGAILGGALAPTIAVLLWTQFGVMFVSVYVAFASFLTLISVWMLTETYETDIHLVET